MGRIIIIREHTQTVESVGEGVQFIEQCSPVADWGILTTLWANLLQRVVNASSFRLIQRTRFIIISRRRTLQQQLAGYTYTKLWELSDQKMARDSDEN